VNIYRILCLGSFLVLAQLALAKLPFSNDAFGKVEGTLDFCTQADAQNAPKYQEGKQALVRDVPENEVKEARDSKEYKDAYSEISDQLAKVPKEQAVKSCRDYLEGK